MITIELKDEEVLGALSGLEALMADLTPVMNEIGDFLVTSTKDRFKAGTAPDGSAWAARSPSTLAIYKRKNMRYGPNPLHKSGEMSGQIFNSYGPDHVQVGSTAIQAAVMQFGAVKGSTGAYFYTTKTGRQVDGASPWGTIPARPYLGLSDSDKTGVIGIVDEWLTRAAGGNTV